MDLWTTQGVVHRGDCPRQRRRIETRKADISTLEKTGHLYFAPTERDCHGPGETNTFIIIYDGTGTPVDSIPIEIFVESQPDFETNVGG